MRRVHLTAMMLAAGGLTGMSSADGPGVASEFGSVRVAGHVYVNAATGERVRTLGTSRIGELYWQNDGGCSFVFRQDDPARDPAGGVDALGTLAVHWGDVPAALTNGYEIAYATNIGCDTAGTGIVGLSMVNVFIDSYDGVIDPGGAGADVTAAFLFEAINGGDCTLGTSLFSGWIFTIDLEGTGFEFSWGDASGGITDLDADGRHDFGYGYRFDQSGVATPGVIGPVTVRPASLGGTGSATGCPDGWDWFNADDSYVGGFWFGGGDCSIPRPYGSFYLNLFGSTDSCSVIDYNGDGIIDFSDYLEFLNRFDAQDPSADLNQDGIVDFGDYLEFLNLFDACSGG